TPVHLGEDPNEYLYTASCYIDDEVRTDAGCIGGVVPEPPEPCETGSWFLPRWTRVRDVGGGVPGAWELTTGYTCPGDPDFAITLDVVERQIEPSPLELQPRTGWVYAGLDTIGYTDDSPQGFAFSLVGRNFDVGAVPVEYSWDFGDGSEPIVTK